MWHMTCVAYVDSENCRMLHVTLLVDSVLCVLCTVCQEQAGVRMVIIQESNSPTNYDKPLRITGDRTSCQAS